MIFAFVVGLEQAEGGIQVFSAIVQSQDASPVIMVSTMTLCPGFTPRRLRMSCVSAIWSPVLED